LQVFKNLRNLNIQGNNITEVPAEIGEIKSLEILRIDFNSNLILPQNIINKNKLRVDFITYNKIDTEKAKKLLIKFGKSRKQYRNDDEIYFWVVDEQLNKDN
jgi:Leucine-rich repeat (LRR) protein